MTAEIRFALALGRRVWHKTAVPIFLERFILPLFVIVVFALAVTNPMGFDKTQRIIGVLVLVLLAFLVAYTIHKKPKPPRKIYPTRNAQISK